MWRNPVLWLFFFFLISIFAKAQGQKWAVYTTDDYIYDIETDGEKLWAGVRGGLVSIDLETNAKQVYISSNSGLRGLGIRDVAVAPDGSKWFGSENAGLFHFDNGEWTQYYLINTGDTLEEIYNIRFAPDGKMWFIAWRINGCSGCPTLFSFEDGLFERHQITYGASTLFVRVFEITENGELWISGSLSLYRYDGNQVLEYYDADNSILKELEYIFQVELDSDGNPWIGTSDSENTSSVYKVSNGEFDQVYSKDNLYFFDIQFDSDGILWVMFETFHQTNPILARYDSDWEEFYETDLSNLPPHSKPPWVVKIGEDGSWWMVSYESSLDIKLYKYKHDELVAFDTRIFPIEDIDCRKMTQDCDGNYWVATDYGFAVYNGVVWEQHYTTEFDADGTPTTMVVDPYTCDVYVIFHDLFDHDALIRFGGGGYEVIPTPSFTSISFDLAFGSDGSVWVPFISRQLGRYHGGNWTIYDESNSPIDMPVMEVEVDANDDVWFTLLTRGIGRFDGEGNWEIYDSSNSPLTGGVMIYIDRQNKLWTDNEFGLLSFNGIDWEFYNLPFNGNFVQDMVQDNAGNYWFSGVGIGLNKFNGQIIEQYRTDNSPLPHNHIRDLMVDAYGNIWSIHPYSLSVFNETGISTTKSDPPIFVGGSVYFDANKNGVRDGQSEPLVRGEKINLYPDSISTFSNFGIYKFYPGPGEFSLEFDTANSKFTPTTTWVHSVSADTTSVDTLHFGVFASNLLIDVKLSAVQGFLRCGQEVNVWVSVCNEDLIPFAGELEFFPDPLLDFLGSLPEPSSTTSTSLIFEIGTIGPYECKFIKLIFKVPGAGFLGQELFSSATFNVEENGNVVGFESEGLRDTILCAYDPNDKTVFPSGEYYENMSLLGDPLDFLIRFQNTGNDTAFNVVIRDTLDADLDWSTFELLSSSHPCEVTLDKNGVVTFTFRDILLLWESVDWLGSQGFVKYRVSPKSGLPDPTLITNTAYIYFDLNPPIVTNRTENILVEELPATAVAEREKQPKLRLFPNPSTGTIFIEMDEHLPGSIVAVFDLNGRLVYTGELSNDKGQISGLDAGFYFVRVANESYSAVGKVIVLR